jgi:hypothetical protein
VVDLADGTSAFAKVGVSELTSGWLRDEHRMYEALDRPFMPRLVAWEDGDRPILLLENLSRLPWPPPWNDSRISAVLRTLDEVAATTPPGWLQPLERHPIDLNGWPRVASDPAPLLSTGLTDATWLEAALPTLLAAAAACRLTGKQLLHLDVRSDNLCFRHERALLVDWNLAAIGNARMDLAFWLPTLEAEGGPRPESILPDAGPEAAVVSGLFASRAGLPEIPTAPRVRTAQRGLLRYALPWACRALGLPIPPGIQQPRSRRGEPTVRLDADEFTPGNR